MREGITLPAFFFTHGFDYVNNLPMQYKRLDLSIGDALRPMRHIAQMAFATASAPIHRYINNPNAMGWSADPALMRAQDAFRDYLNHTGWKREGWSGVGNDGFIFTDGGTTRGFDLILHDIARQVKKANDARRKRDQVKPVILMPVPTYGFFLETPALYGIEVVTVQRDIRNNGYLDIGQLKEVIRQSMDDNKRIVAYYDCTPHNPLGFIRSQAETENVYELMRALKYYYADADKKIPVGQAYTLDGRKFKPSCTQLKNYPVLIDDLVYDGLQYDRRKTLSVFGKMENGLDHSLTLMGPSKAGLSGLRTGIIIGGSEYLGRIRHVLKLQSYFPSYASLAVIEHFYAASGDGKIHKTRHMARMNADHKLNGLLMKAMINGIDTMPELNARDRQKIIQTVGRHYGLSETDAVAYKLAPIKGAQIITTPEAGFFHLIDFNEGAKQSYDDTLHLKLCDEFSVQMVPVGWASKTRETNINRVSFAVPTAQIFDFADRVRQCSAQFFKEYDRAAEFSQPARLMA